MNEYDSAPLRHFGNLMYHLKWLGADEAAAAGERRSALLAKLAPHAVNCYADNKIYYRDISPGCKICGEGGWSCLYINNRCNAKCFFCPSEQNESSYPETTSVAYRRPIDYADFCEFFNIRGMSISGGEPLLTPKRTFAFFREAAARLLNIEHRWMYTNGFLVNRENLEVLRNLGVNEIRFNIAAMNYNIEKARLAVGYIPVVTVEIPAVPEDLPLLKQKIHELADAGVKHLNLHQIRCTPYNAKHVISRDYTLVPGPHPAVLESEIAALDAMAYAAEKNIPIGINYCSFIYRNRFHARSVALRAAKVFRAGHESVTEKGNLRGISARMELGVIEVLKSCGTGDDHQKLYFTDAPSGRIIIHPSLAVRVLDRLRDIRVEYEQLGVADGSSLGEYAFTLPHGKIMSLKRKKLGEYSITNNTAHALMGMIDHGGTDGIPVAGQVPDDIIRHELIDCGFQQYRVIE